VTARAWALFAALCLLWGIPYFLIKVAIPEVSPVTIVFVRLAIAALVLLPVALSRDAFRHLLGRWLGIVPLGLIGVALPFLLIAAGEQRIASSLTGLLIATEPMMIALLALRLDASERVGGARLVGLLLGVAGVACVLGLDVHGEPSELLGAGMILLAAFCYAGAALFVKHRYADVPPLGTATAAMVVSAVALTPAALLTLPARWPTPPTLLALVSLGVVCTAAGYLCYYGLIARAGAARATVVTYVNPAVAVALGALALGEPVSAATLVGFALIIAGSWLGTRGSVGARAPEGKRQSLRTTRHS
jgi:drug/metabolite transporter (DMT)-like permease